MEKLRVLFQGDSITDMDRDRSNIRNMGNGYPLFVASNFRADNPKFDIDFFDLEHKSSFPVRHTGTQNRLRSL